MAILASSNVNTVFMNRLIRTGKLGTVNAAITVYSGAKPTASDYIANFATTYNSTTGVFLWHSNTSTVWTQANNTIYMSTTPGNTIPLHSGTATWAVLWCTSIGIGSMGAGFPGGGSNGFIIVDVSTIDGIGIVQFQSTNLSTSDAAISINSAGFSIT